MLNKIRRKNKFFKKLPFSLFLIVFGLILILKVFGANVIGAIGDKISVIIGVSLILIGIMYFIIKKV